MSITTYLSDFSSSFRGFIQQGIRIIERLTEALWSWFLIPLAAAFYSSVREVRKKEGRETMIMFLGQDIFWDKRLNRNILWCWWTKMKDEETSAGRLTQLFWNARLKVVLFEILLDENHCMYFYKSYCQCLKLDLVLQTWDYLMLNTQYFVWVGKQDYVVLP